MESTNNYKNTGRNSESESLLPPQAQEVEESVLGGMLIEQEAAHVCLQLLQVDDFYNPANRMIFQTLQELYEKDKPFDLVTVENQLRDKEWLERIGGAGYLAQLTRNVSSAANIEYHAHILIEKGIKRKLITTCNEMMRNAYDATTDPYELLDNAEQRIFELANTRANLDTKPLKTVMKDTLEYLENIRGKDSGITGVPSGLDLDKQTAGWQPGDLIVVAARPSMGKTAFTLSMASNTALYPDEEKRTGVAIFSLEMSDQSLVQRFLTMEARVSAQKTRTGSLDDDEFKHLIHAAGRLHEAEIFVDDTPGLSIMELRSKCRRLKNEHNIGLVMVDYLQLMTAPRDDRSHSREQEIANISRGLKALAKELNVPVIALSQLSRAVETRGGDKRPQLSDLRESGSIEQDADVVCFLYRPEYYGITTDEMGNSTENIAEVIIGKQRNGPTGTIKLNFIEKYARFDNLTSATIEGELAEADLSQLPPGDPSLKDDDSSEKRDETGRRRGNTGYVAPPDEDSPF